MVAARSSMVVALPCVAQFVIVLDATIVAIALPAMQSELGLSTTALGWVITLYTLVFGGCLLAAGRLADRVGRRRAFTAGLGLFTAASLVCGLAPSGAVLLAGRAAQGLGAALVSPAALALITAARPEGPARARALGWWTASAAGGGASGWVLGGVLSGLLDWRWVFLVNVPICAAGALLAPRVLREWRDPAPARPDVAGAVLATAGLAALVLAFSLAEAYGPLSLPTLGSLATALVLLASLARVEARAPDPLLDRRRLRRTGVTEPNLVAAALTAATTPPMFLCTLHAQQVLGLGPATAGLLFPPFNLAVVAGSLAGPRAVAAVGGRRAMAGGLLAIAAGALALCAIGVSAPALPTLLTGFVLMGAGLGVASVASTARGTAALAAGDQGLASGLLATSAQIGTALGLAVVIPIAAARTDALGGDAGARVAGFELGFVLAAALAAAAAAAIGLAALRGRASRPLRAAVTGRERRSELQQDDRVRDEQDREQDRPAVQVALHQRAAGGAARRADAEGAGHARVLPGVQEHQEDHHDRDEDLRDGEDRGQHGASV
jgi:MFS family permease